MAAFSILLLDTEPGTHNHYITLAIADALRRHPAVARVRVAGHDDALSAFASEPFDTFIAFGGGRRHAPLLGRLASLSRISVLWTTEDPYELADNVRCSTGFDLVFTNDRASVDAYEGRAMHLPLAASALFQDFAVVDDDEGYLYDLLFIGTAWPNRVDSLNAILGRLPRDLRVKLALPWNVHIGPPALDDRSLITDWRCSNRDFARMANRSRVVLTLPRAFSASETGKAQGSSPPPRLFEAALAGGFQVVVSPQPEIRDYYEAGAEIALCADEQDGARTIAEMLARPQARIAAAQAARTRTRAEHLYDHRVAMLLDAAAKQSRRSVPARRPTVRTVLMVSHNRTGYRGGGGVEIYLDALTGLAPDYEILFLFPVLGEWNWALRLEGRDFGQTIDCGEIGLPKLTDPHVEGVFQRILFERRVDLVHIHHLLHLPLSLPLVARACGVPVVYHLHDHYLICERWLLLDHAGRFCDVAARGREQCDACMIAASNYPPGAKSRRDNFVSLVVRAIDAFITSTPTTGAYLRAFYPEISPEQVVTVEMLTPAAAPAAVRASPRWAEENRPRLTVAVLGNFAAHKGGGDIIELMRLCEEYRIHFKVFGHVDEHHAGRLRGIPPHQVTLLGAYEPHAIHALLAGCDVSLHLSTWPETFVIALSEAWQAGLVPVATAMGAFVERIDEGIDGFLVPPHDPGTVRARLLDLYFHPAKLAQMRAAVMAKRFRSVASHLDAMRGVYETLIAARPCPHERVPDRMNGAFALSLAEIGLRVNAPSWVLRDIQWDGSSAASPGPTQRPRPVVPLLDDLPEPDRKLTAETLPLTHASLVFSRDALKLDDREIANPSGHDLVLHRLTVKGWLRRRHAPQPLRTYLRFTGPSRTTYAALHGEERRDVADNLADPGAASSGYLGTVDVAGLEFGAHAIDLLQVAGDRLLVALGLYRIFAGGALAGTIAGFRRTSEPIPSVQGSAVGELRQNLAEAGGILLATTRDVWAIMGRCEAAGTDDAPLTLRLQPGEGQAWEAPIAPARAQDGTFHLAVATAGLKRGRYAVSLCDGVTTRRSAALRELEIVPGPGRYRFDRTMPAGFRRHFIKRTKRGLAIEWAARTDAEPGKGMVECRGWAFAQGHGEVLCTCAHWQDTDGRAQSCISASLARPDIAAHLSASEAVDCGFEFGIPEYALRSGHVRLFQRYRRRTIEFTAFSKAFRARVDMV